MVALYVGGNRIETIADAKQLFDQSLSRNQSVEICSDEGKVLGRFVPEHASEPICPWEPGLTYEEMERRRKQPGKPLSEILKRLGAE